MTRGHSEEKCTTHIIGAGMVVLDVILNNSSRTPVFMAGGTCGNILAGLSFFGWESTAISRAGEDIARQVMVEGLERSGVNTRYITKETNQKTPRIVEKLKSNGECAKHSFLLRCPTCNSYLPRFRSPKADTMQVVLQMQRNTDVYFFDKVTTSILKLASFYRETGALIFFEPKNLKNMAEVKESGSICHILKYSGDESGGNGGGGNNSEIDELMESSQISLVIRTSGEHGLSFKVLGDDTWHCRDSYPPHELVDTCGAGDWSTVGFLFYLEKLAKGNHVSLIRALKSNVMIDEALRFAQILSSLSCMFVGAQGLSTSMDQESILALVESHMQENNISLLRVSDRQAKDGCREVKPSVNIANHSICPTCLLEI